MKRIWRGVAVLCFGLLIGLGLPRSWGQGVTIGTIEGTITDSAGAVVPGAVVTVVKNDTNATHTVTTNAEGAFVVENLPIGTYNVKIEKAGFTTAVRDHVEVTVNQVIVLNVPLLVGNATQTVVVQANTVAITQDSGDRSVLISEDQIQDLPLEIASGPRLDDTFLELAPGTQGTTFSARINGGPDFSQDFYYDGIPYMNADGGGRQEGGGPPVDAIDEFAIDTNAYSAQYGRGTGLLDFHIHSGTNSLHGGAWEYLRNNVLDARGYFAGPESSFIEKQNEFGFKVGGPVYLPKIYNGHDKTFFFFLLNWYKFRGGISTSLLTLPTQQMLQGNFSQLPFPIYDPATTVSDGHGGLTRQPFLNNMIPLGRLSTTSSPFISLVPTATLPGIVNNAVAVAPAIPINNFYPVVKIDHNITKKLVLHASYYQVHENIGDASPIIPGLLGSGDTDLANLYEPRVSLDQNFSSRFLNQTGFSMQYTESGAHYTITVPASFSSPIATVGLPFPAIFVQGMPQFGTGANNGQTAGGCWPCVFIRDDLKWTKGRHAFTFGTELRWEDEKDAFAQNIGTYDFTNGATSLPDSPNYGTLGYSFASFFLGTLDAYSRTGVADNRTVNTGYRALYAQDDIKLTPRLTINAGLRWDYSIPVWASTNQFSTFDPSVANPGAGNLPGSIVYAGMEGGACISQGGASLCRKQISNTYYNNWQPRIGFAYMVNNRTVVRGGYGIASIRGGATTLMGPDIADNYLTGFQYQDTLVSLNNGVSPPPGLQPTWDVGIPPVGTPPPRTLTLANNQSLDWMRPIDGKTGYLQNWSFTLERELPDRIAWETSYVGSSAVHIGSFLLNPNQVPSSDLSLGSLLYADVGSAQANAAGINPPYPGFAGTVAQALRPYPQYLSITDYVETNGHQSYHSLQERLQKEYSKGLNFIVSYTWSKTITDALDQFSNFGNAPLDTGQLRRERQVLGWDTNGTEGPQILSVAGSYKLPIGPGQKFANRGGPVGEIVGGWTGSWVLSYNDGPPSGLLGTGTGNPIFNGPQRENVVPGVNPKLWNGGRFNARTDLYVNSAAFSDAGAFALGNAPPTLPSLPTFPLYNESLSAIKNFKIWESTTFQFRTDFFNAFNRVSFNQPDANINDLPIGAFGKTTGQQNSPRVIQVAGRITF